MSRKEPLNRLLEEATRLHGHFGPFLVLGVKLALFAEESLGAEVEGCFLEVPKKVPTICVIDGVEAIIGAGRVRSRDAKRILATFRGGGKSVKISVRDDVLDEFESKCRRHYEEYLRGIIPHAKEVEVRPPAELFELRNR